MSVQDWLDQNREWVTKHTASDPDYFGRHTQTHTPRALVIACSDARVPVDTITGAGIGELFVHRNIANQVIATDNNILSAVQYAVEVLKVQDIIICGHEGCGGVKAALGDAAPNHVEHWINTLRTTVRLYGDELREAKSEDEQWRLLVELNVTEQVYNLSRLPVVQAAWAAGMPLAVHGWVYGLGSGLLRDLHVTIDGSVASTRMQDIAALVGAGSFPHADAS
jgi:carbonic anhydrase